MRLKVQIKEVLTMPIYAYTCKQCGEKFDKFRGINDDDDTLHCPVCDAPGPRRDLSMFSSRSGSKSGSGTGFRPT